MLKRENAKYVLIKTHKISVYITLLGLISDFMIQKKSNLIFFNILMKMD